MSQFLLGDWPFALVAQIRLRNAACLCGQLDKGTAISVRTFWDARARLFLDIRPVSLRLIC